MFDAMGLPIRSKAASAELLLEHELGKTLPDAPWQAVDELHTSVEETVQSKQVHMPARDARGRTKSLRMASVPIATCAVSGV